nr:MarR family transcriptional regulator [Quadrisphaera sp. RL12-1S]
MLASLSLWLSDAVWEAVSRGDGPDHEDIAVLVLVGQEPLRITDLAAATGRTHSATVRAIDRLAAAGLVDRHPGAARDARAVLVELTAAGEAARRSALDARARALTPVTALLDEEQRAALGPLLEVMLEAVTTSAAAGTRICRLCDDDVCVPLGCPVEQRCLVFETSDQQAPDGSGRA